MSHRMRIVEHSILFKLPILRNYSAITLWPYVFFKGPIDERILAHEEVHFEQIQREGVLHFYLCYIVEFVYLLLLCKSTRFRWFEAYYSITYEQEAREKSRDRIRR